MTRLPVLWAWDGTVKSWWERFSAEAHLPHGQVGSGGLPLSIISFLPVFPFFLTMDFICMCLCLWEVACPQRPNEAYL